jgi:hypothetical protein
MDVTTRVIEVFEIIAHQQLDLTARPGMEPGAICLQSAQLLLEPRLHALIQQVDEIHKQHGITDSRIESQRAAEAVTAYVIGILSGLDLAGRPDIVGKFATLYAAQARQSIDSLFAGNGNVHQLSRRAN